ncbi:MAG: type II toxin-antitoxin system VapC family toxin [Arenimonas sp.]|nr:type II toxin-antitoxin system VapC family toxin [Rhizobium sp.]MBW8448064.1 type II toxin-antitoxin system VapC family toxin [Arenimonas sp.]
MRIYLDTNIFIAAFERRDAVSDRLGDLFSTGLDRSDKMFVTSELTISELLVVPLRDGRRALVGYYSDVLSENEWLHAYPVAKAVFVSAAGLRAERRGLRLPDAIHLATALATGCSHFMTEDSSLAVAGETAVPALRMLRPDEPTLKSLLESLQS